MDAAKLELEALATRQGWTSKQIVAGLEYLEELATGTEGPNIPPELSEAQANDISVLANNFMLAD